MLQRIAPLELSSHKSHKRTRFVSICRFPFRADIILDMLHDAVRTYMSGCNGNVSEGCAVRMIHSAKYISTNDVPFGPTMLRGGHMSG